jgi:hypothetical protein
MSITAPCQNLTIGAPPALATLPDLSLDGYLTGVVVAPRPIPSLCWLAVLLAGDDLMRRDAEELRAVREAVMARHTAIAGEIDRHLSRLERDRICGYRPAFLPRRQTGTRQDRSLGAWLCDRNGAGARRVERAPRR